MKELIFRDTSRCKHCPLRGELVHSVPFEQVGERVEWVFISEAPSKPEWESGRPFVGPAGSLVRGILDRLVLNNYLLANTVQCPSLEGDKTRTPQEREYLHCGWHLREWLSQQQPRAVFLLGKVAAANFGLSGSMESLISQNPHRLPDYPGIPFFVLYHPSYILRSSKGNYRQHPAYRSYFYDFHNALLQCGYPQHEFLQSEERLNYATYPFSQYPTVFERFRGKDFSLDFETIGSELHAERPILGIGLGTAAEQAYLDLRGADSQVLKEIFQALSDLVDYNKSQGYQVLVYNQSFESGVFFQILQDRIRFFDDVWTMAKSLGYSGSLKELAQTLLKAPAWSEEVWEIVDWATQLVRWEKSKPGVLRAHLLSGEKAPKTLERLLAARPAALDPQVVVEQLSLFESGEEQLGWSLVPIQIMALYNARDTYWTYRLWEYLRPQLSPVFQEIYQEQENLSTVIQTAKLRISEPTYHRMKLAFLTQYLQALAAFLRHPVAYQEVWKRQLYQLPLSKSEPLKPFLTLLRQGDHKNPIYTELGQLSWEALRERSEPEAQRLLELLESKSEVLAERYQAQWESLLQRIEGLDYQRVTLAELESLLEELEVWYNPRSPKQGLEIFNRVMDHPTLNLALYLYQITVELGDFQVSQLLQAFGPFPSWLQRTEEVLQRVSPSLQARAMRLLDEARSAFDGNHLNLIYSALSRFFNFHVDHPETYPEDPALRATVEAYIQMRKAKKAIKVVSTYLDGRTGLRDALRADSVTVNHIPWPVGSSRGQHPWAITDYIAIGTDTHRWSSPYHTIPSGTEVRELYESRWGEEGIFIHYDYAQMEVRVLAALAQEQKLLQLLLDPSADVHLVTASLVFGIPKEEVQDYQRRYAKTATFAILYGKSLHSFATTYTAGSLEQAQAVFDAYFKAFPGIERWIKSMHRKADQLGKVSTLFHPEDFLDVQLNEPGYYRRAQNYPVQSSASSLVAVAAMRAFRQAQAQGIRLVPIGFTHDALDFEVHLQDLPQALELLYDCAVRWPREALGVPVQADFELGTTGNVGVELVREGEHWELSGWTRYVDPLLERLSRFYHFQVLQRKESSKRVNLETIFVGRAAISLFVGSEQPHSKLLLSAPQPRSSKGSSWIDRSISLPVS